MKTRMLPLPKSQNTPTPWDYPVNVYVPGASEPVATCLVSELRECTAGLGRDWSTRAVPPTPDLLDLLGWRP